MREPVVRHVPGPLHQLHLEAGLGGCRPDRSAGRRQYVVRPCRDRAAGLGVHGAGDRQRDHALPQLLRRADACPGAASDRRARGRGGRDAVRFGDVHAGHADGPLGRPVSRVPGDRDPQRRARHAGGGAERPEPVAAGLVAGAGAEPGAADPRLQVVQPGCDHAGLHQLGERIRVRHRRGARLAGRGQGAVRLRTDHEPGPDHLHGRQRRGRPELPLRLRAGDVRRALPDRAPCA